MSDTLSKVFIFTAGAAIGSVVTWKLLKTKYEQIAREEIEAVREVYGVGQNDLDDEEESETDKPVQEEHKESFKHNSNQKPDLMEYAATIKDLGYINNEENEDETDGEEDKDVNDRPYVISPEEFGEFDEYEIVSLIHFADDILTDDDYEIIDDIEGAVGLDYATHFGEYEQDSVYIRNDGRECDYEILRDERNFADL